MRNGHFLLFPLALITLISCHKKDAGSTSPQQNAAPAAQMFDLNASGTTIADYKAAVENFQKGQGPMPVLPMGQISFSGNMTIVGSTDIPIPQSAIALRADAKDGDQQNIGVTKEQVDDALKACPVCTGDATPTPTPAPTVGTSPGDTVSPTPTPTTSVTATPTPTTKATASSRYAKQRFAIGRQCLQGCPLGLFASYIWFVGTGGHLMVASVCTDGRPSTSCTVSFGNGTSCTYNIIPIFGTWGPGSYSCNGPTNGLWNVTGALCN